MELSSIIAAFLPTAQVGEYRPLESGLIHSTFVVQAGKEKYILQKLNASVFKNSEAISANHWAVNRVLQQSDYSKVLSNPLLSNQGQYFVKDPSGNEWRMQEFIDNSVTYTQVPDAEMAFRAAQCFSEFYRAVNGREKPDLKVALPDFINFQKRISDYQNALQNATSERKERSRNSIEFVNEHLYLPEKWWTLQSQNLLPERIIHADPKISNILFDTHRNALAVIDLDTVMSASLLYDFGDMVRSYTNLCEEDDAEQIENFSFDRYKAVKEGFLFHLNGVLTEIEVQHLDYAAELIVYIQAMRFLTDYLNGDVYYNIQKEHHNLDRTKNQIHLMKNIQRHG